MTFLRPRQRKRIASFALGCWLFAAFVAAVHACAVDGELVGAHPVTMGATHHDEQGDNSPPGCEQFCTDVALVKSTLAQDQLGEPALLAAPVLGAPMVTGAALVTSPLDRPHPSPGIALYTRFLRLAL